MTIEQRKKMFDSSMMLRSVQSKPMPPRHPPPSKNSANEDNIKDVSRNKPVGRTSRNPRTRPRIDLDADDINEEKKDNILSPPKEMSSTNQQRSNSRDRNTNYTSSTDVIKNRDSSILNASGSSLIGTSQTLVDLQRGVGSNNDTKQLQDANKTIADLKQMISRKDEEIQTWKTQFQALMERTVADSKEKKKTRSKKLNGCS